MTKNTIKVENLSKIYRIYNNPQERFKEVISNGRKRYGYDHYALDNISFNVKEGEILGILGVNGSGKSTLLKIITGVLQPTCGTVEVNGKISALLELGAGFNPEYTGIENIYFNGMLMGFSRKEMEDKIQGIIDFADIGDFINQPVKTYSSGMYVRLAYSIAVSIEPDILIVDEALAVGDAYFQLKSMSKMQELFKKGKTVLFVSHDTATMKSLCNTALYLDKGKMVAYGNAQDIVEMYEAKVRENMSDTGKGVEYDTTHTVLSSEFGKISKENFYEDQEYIRRVASTREGNGKAKVYGVQLLDVALNEIQDVEYNQECILRLHIKFEEECQITVGYHIRDEHNIPILGSNTLIEGIGEIDGKRGDKLIVDFRFRAPLRDGRYNIMTVLSKVIYVNRSSEFVDVTKDGLYFNMMEGKPYRIWNKVQLPNSINIRRIED